MSGKYKGWGSWEGCDFDLQEQLTYVLNTRLQNRRAKCEAALTSLDECHQMIMEFGTEEQKKKYMKTVKKTKKLINKELKGFERQVPSLKVLSAVTVCKKFKDSDEIQSLGPWGQAIQRPQRFGSGGQPIKRRPGILRGPLWSGHMGGSCLGKPQRSEDRVCGFCRFPEWSEAQKLPKEVLLFCRNVLHYLGKNDKDFIHEDWGGLEDNDDDEDDEDDYDENDYTSSDEEENAGDENEEGEEQAPWFM